MGTYVYEKIVTEYTNDRMAVEMATGHSLQHIGKLYEAQNAANISRYKLQGKVDGLEYVVNTLQKEVTRLTALACETPAQAQ